MRQVRQVHHGLHLRRRIQEVRKRCDGKREGQDQRPGNRSRRRTRRSSRSVRAQRARRDPHPLQLPGARAVRLLLPVRRRGQGAAEPRSRLRHAGGARHGGDDPQRPDRRVPSDGARAAPLEPLRRLRLPLHRGMPRARGHPGVHRPLRDGDVPGGDRPHPRGEPAPGRLRARLRPQVRGGLPQGRHRRAGRDQLGQAVPLRPAGGLRRRARLRPAHGQEGGDRGGRARRAHRRVVPRAPGAQAGHLRGHVAPGRDAQLRHPRVPPPRRRRRPGGRLHLPGRRGDPVQHPRREGRAARRPDEEARRRLSGPRRLGRQPDAASRRVRDPGRGPGGGIPPRAAGASRRRSRGPSSSWAAATPRWTSPAPRGGSARTR